ncbi:MAG: VOC family protein [Candidatus Acidiferrales bacterium]
MSMKRHGDSWKTPDEYGRLLPLFTVNLVVRDISAAIEFYKTVLSATVIYSDIDFAALHLHGLEFMLHADHSYDHHPWYARLTTEKRRGLGAELRLFAGDPDAIEARARKFGATILQASQDKPHGWRDVIVEDPDGYAWAVGVPLEK